MQELIELRESIKARMRIESLGIRKVAKQCDLSPSSIHRFLSSKEVSKRVSFKLSRWLNERRNGGTTATIKSDDGEFQIIVRRIK